MKKKKGIEEEKTEVVVEEKATEVKEKKGVKPIVIVLVIILCLGISIPTAFYLGTKYDDNNETETKEAEKKEEEKKEETKKDNDKDKDIDDDEEEKFKLEKYPIKEYPEIKTVGKKIEDLNVITQLEKKTNMLFNSLDYSNSNFLYKETNSLKKLDKDQLLYIALANSKRVEDIEPGVTCIYENHDDDGKKDFWNDSSLDTIECTGKEDDIDLSNYGMLYFSNADEVNKIYDYLFGTTPSVDIIRNTCPLIRKSNNLNIYVINYNCGGTGFPIPMNYIFDYTYDENKAYVYVAYGVGSNGYIFTDYEKKYAYSGVYSKYYDYNDSYDYEINENSYKEFSKYKFIYEKKDDNYYFTGIERLD